MRYEWNEAICEVVFASADGPDKAEARSGVAESGTGEWVGEVGEVGEVRGSELSVMADGRRESLLYSECVSVGMDSPSGCGPDIFRRRSAWMVDSEADSSPERLRACNAATDAGVGVLSPSSSMAGGAGMYGSSFDRGLIGRPS